LVTALVTVLMMGITAVLVGLRQGSSPDVQADAATTDSSVPSMTPPPEITWSAVGGVPLPTSLTHGPRNDRDGLAAGFSNSEPGAALAAVHLLIRTGPTVGPAVFEPTIASQATGANVAALKLTTSELYADSSASPGTASGTQILGYRVESYASSPGSATVDVVLTSPALRETDRSLQTTVSLEWINGDWWIVAPPLGDWGQVSTPIGELPDGLQRYEDIG
jgi:hypothetical protein